ncbi:MAG: Asp23/Gls24 family envelope stress response protein [Clostridiales bacterium]|nr:Asp23/Gls24 family envelope stress response protein [Clostridiales bacterium]
MATKKDNLPLTLDQDIDSTGTITYANEVIAIIAGVATNEVEGVAGMISGGGISEVFGRNKNITKGVKVELGTEETSIDIYLIIEYGMPIQTVAGNVQENVRKAIESMTGLHVVRVDVHVQGVSFEKEQKEALVGLESLSALESENAAQYEQKPIEPVKVEFEGTPTPAEEHGPIEDAVINDVVIEEVSQEELPMQTEDAEPADETSEEVAAEDEVETIEENN